MLTVMGVEVKAVDVILRTAKIAPAPVSSTFPPSVAAGTGHLLLIVDDYQRQGTNPSTFAGGLFLAFFSPVIPLFLLFLCVCGIVA